MRVVLQVLRGCVDLNDLVEQVLWKIPKPPSM